MARLNNAIIGFPGDAKPQLLRSAVINALVDRFPGHEIFTEFRFSPSRKYRFDLAVLPEAVAIEFQGGVWVRGRHNRGMGYRRDAEKALAAAACGWVVINLTYDMLKDNLGETIGSVIHVIEQRARAKR